MRYCECFQNQGWENGKISRNQKRREKEISKNVKRETAREKGEEGVKEVTAFSFIRCTSQEMRFPPLSVMLILPTSGVLSFCSLHLQGHPPVQSIAPWLQLSVL